MGKWLFFGGCALAIINPILGAVVIFCGVMAWAAENNAKERDK